MLRDKVNSSLDTYIKDSIGAVENHPANKKQSIESHSRNVPSLVLHSADTIPFPRYFQNQLDNHHKILNAKKAKEMQKLYEKVQKDTSTPFRRSFRKTVTDSQKKKNEELQETPLSRDDISQLTFSKGTHTIFQEEEENEPTLPELLELSPKRANKMVNTARIVSSIKKSLEPQGGKKAKLSPNHNVRMHELRGSDNLYREFLLGSIKERLARPNFPRVSLRNLCNPIAPEKKRPTILWKKAKSKLWLTKLKVHEDAKEFLKKNPLTESCHYSPEYIEKEFGCIIKLISEKRSKGVVNTFKQVHKEAMKGSYTERPSSDYL